MSDLFHYFQALQNTSGDALIGYFWRALNGETVQDIYADENSTPIVSVSGKDNLAKTDSDGNVSFYITPGTYNIEIYGPDGTSFYKRVPNVAMTSTQGPVGPKGDPGAAGNVASTLAELKAALTTNDTMIYDHATFKWTTGDYTGQADDVNIIQSDLAAISTGAWVRQSAASIQAADGNTVQENLDHGGYLSYTGLQGTRTTDFWIKNQGLDLSADTRVDTSGATDSYAGLAAGLTAAAASYARLPKGNYKLGTGLVWPSEGLVLEGQGYDSALIVDADNLVILTAAALAGKLELNNLRLVGDKTATSSADGIGLKITDVDDISLDQIWYEGFGNAGLFLQNAGLTSSNSRAFLDRLRMTDMANALGSGSENAALNIYGMWDKVSIGDLIVEAAALNPAMHGFNISQLGTLNAYWRDLMIARIRVYGSGKCGISLDNENPTSDLQSGIVKIGQLHVENCGYEGFKSKNVDIIQIGLGTAINCETAGGEVPGNLQGSFYFNGANDVQANLVVWNGGTDAVRLTGRSAGTTAGVGRARYNLNIESHGCANGAALAITQQVYGVDARIASYDDKIGLDIHTSPTFDGPLDIKVSPIIKRATTSGVNISGAAGNTVGPVILENPIITECQAFGIVANYCDELHINGGKITDNGQGGVSKSGVRVGNTAYLSLGGALRSANVAGTTQDYGLSLGSGNGTIVLGDAIDFSGNATGSVLYVAPTKIRGRAVGWMEATSASYDPPSLAAGASTPLQTITIVGAELGDEVSVSWSADLLGAEIKAFVAATSGIRWWITNQNGANPLDLAAGTAKFRVTKRQG